MPTRAEEDGDHAAEEGDGGGSEAEPKPKPPPETEADADRSRLAEGLPASSPIPMAIAEFPPRIARLLPVAAAN